MGACEPLVFIFSMIDYSQEQFHFMHLLVVGFGFDHQQKIGPPQFDHRRIVYQVWVTGYFALWDFV